MQKLIKIFNDICPEIDLSSSERLVDDGILDSLDIVALVTEINETFDVSVPPEEITPENFNSSASIMALIERLRDN